ncbi:N-acetylglucosamine-binding protein GbpA, partial [Vibrio sp. 1249-1]|nr:N-acetylglucosamine-binding protein GbpA [Vibrio sp. 1249-1]
AKNWSYALATKINQEQTKLQAGQYAEDKFTPVYGTNPVYLQANSGLERVEVGYKIETPAPEYSLTVDGLADEYIIESTTTTLDLTLTAEGDLNAELTVYNHHREPLASWADEMKDGSVEAVSLALSKSEPGHHMLVTRIKDKGGNLVDQQTLDFHLKEESVTPPPSGE